ncbi:hypothetical protein D3C76_1428750 [compost metagenome]
MLLQSPDFGFPFHVQTIGTKMHRDVLSEYAIVIGRPFGVQRGSIRSHVQRQQMSRDPNMIGCNFTAAAVHIYRRGYAYDFFEFATKVKLILIPDLMGDVTQTQIRAGHELLRPVDPES